jgi:hypothetical protein
MERAKGIEPSYAAWEVVVLPLNYARLPISSPGRFLILPSGPRIVSWRVLSGSRAPTAMQACELGIVAGNGQFRIPLTYLPPGRFLEFHQAWAELGIAAGESTPGDGRDQAAAARTCRVTTSIASANLTFWMPSGNGFGHQGGAAPSWNCTKRSIHLT